MILCAIISHLSTVVLQHLYTRINRRAMRSRRFMRSATLAGSNNHTWGIQVCVRCWAAFTLKTHLKVPRSTSCPLSRTWMPSLRREPKAMYSPRAQSICRFFTSSARLRRIRDTPGEHTHTKNFKHSYYTEKHEYFCCWGDVCQIILNKAKVLYNFKTNLRGLWLKNTNKIELCV